MLHLQVRSRNDDACLKTSTLPKGSSLAASSYAANVSTSTSATASGMPAHSVSATLPSSCRQTPSSRKHKTAYVAGDVATPLNQATPLSRNTPLSRDTPSALADTPICLLAPPTPLTSPPTPAKTTVTTSSTTTAVQPPPLPAAPVFAQSSAVSSTTTSPPSGQTPTTPPEIPANEPRLSTPPHNVLETPPTITPRFPCTSVALYNCSADNFDELTFRAGQKIRVLRTVKDDDEWWVSTSWQGLIHRLTDRKRDLDMNTKF